jgi:hypothetical protein
MPARAFPRQGCRRPTPRLCEAGAGRLKHVSSVARPARRYGRRPELAESMSLRGLTCSSTDQTVSVYSAPLHIRRAGPQQANAEVLCRRRRRRNNC